MTPWALDFDEIGNAQLALVGGKAVHLAELSRVAGIRVPDGFCVTTHAYDQAIASAPAIRDAIERLSRLDVGDATAIREQSAAIRRRIEAVDVPGGVADAIASRLARLGPSAACAVRSSATAEDLPTASFAGQLDTFLNVTGAQAILEHVRRCWASLFTERAVSYRERNGFDHRAVRIAVIVQRMVIPKASGVLFTADPLTGHRKVASIEAVPGLGEALVSGRANPDTWKVRDDRIVESAVASKERQPALTGAQAVRLAQLGRRIEAHFGSPQDIEWCLADDDFHVVQSRPITTLFPVPEARDAENHVYVSVGHQQMMTDAMKPLGVSFWQMTTPRPMAEAGGRLFVDVTPMLASSASRDAILATLGRSDPLIRDALERVLERGDFVRSRQDEGPAWTPPGAGAAAIATDPAIVDELIERGRASIVAATAAIQPKNGPDLMTFILDDLKEMKRVQSDPRHLQVIMAGMEAAWWLNDRMHEWLGERNVADTLTQAVPNNVTSEMGLALLDVADVVRRHPELLDFLRRAADDGFLDELPRFEGGGAARDAIERWLETYGMRGPGEIDITRPRWRERPTMLLPLILDNVRNFAPGEAERRVQQGREAATTKAEELLARLRALPDGAEKAEETRRMIDRVRTFAGYREFPKYAMVSRYFIYKQALLREAGRLVSANVLREREDIFWLRFDELQDVVKTKRADHALIRQRKDAFRSYQALRPPRVLTSEGEGLSGTYRRHGLPAGALAGLPVSAGVVEGRARVVLDIADADLELGDILVTAYTDPSWTPLFVAIAGLVTEVGGLMTHGAVIAREYGVPAVVGVDRATRRIQDGQRIRVYGTDGYVEILS